MNKDKKTIPFGVPKSKRKLGITDSGEFGNLKFEIYDKWRTIHLIEEGTKRNKVFKKDCDLFEEQFEDIDFDDMSDGDTAKVEGSGDNADLIITVKDGEIVMHLESKDIPTLRRFKNLLSAAKEKVMGK
jgi:hypothetical protein